LNLTYERAKPVADHLIFMLIMLALMLYLQPSVAGWSWKITWWCIYFFCPKIG